MAEFGDLPGNGSGPETEARPSRRFAGFVESPVARRLSTRRLGWAVLGSAGLLALLAATGVRGVRGLTRWVAERPENQIRFADIRLIPEPPAYMILRSPGLLEEVRSEAKLPDTLPILDLDLKQLTKDFRRHPWVEDVARVEVTLHGLAVAVVFRRPVAVVEVVGQPSVVIDEDGAILPSDGITWIERKPRPRVKGVAEPLPILFEVPAAISRIPGMPYKSSMVDGIAGKADTKVRKLARLAGYLQGKPRMTPKGRAYPDFAWIAPSKSSDGLVLLDTDRNWVYWGSAPGAELPQGILADSKWKMLGERIDEKGPLRLTPDQYLGFGPGGAEDRDFPRESPDLGKVDR